MKTINIIKSARRTHSFGIINTRKLSVSNSKQKPTNRWHLSAEGFLLLPSALRPHLLSKKCKNHSFRDIFYDKIASNCAKIHQKLQFFAKINGKLAKNTQILAIFTLFQIVAISTIFGYLCSNPVSAASLTLTIPSSFSLDITPGVNGVFSKSPEQKINVKTDNSSGYTLSIKAKNGDNSNVLLNGENKLNSITESTTEDNFKSDTKFNNTWGYLPSKFNSIDNTNFLPGPTNEESILEATEEASETGTDYNITIGAKVDNTILTGSYSNNFVFQASANAIPEPLTMQGFGDYCKNMEEHESLSLVDTRDNNTYTVAKLKDGNCWMTQNLRLGDSKLTNRTITSENSDISASSFTLPSSSTSGFEDNGSYDFPPSSARIYIDSTWGGYYNWRAAKGTTLSNESPGFAQVSGSICPSGWRLPTGGYTASNKSSETKTSDFYKLLNAYGYDDGSDSGKITAGSNLLASPIPGFTLSGGYNSSGSYNRNTDGRYWSEYTDSENPHTFGIFLIVKGSSPLTARNSKGLGFSIRCIADPAPKVTVNYNLNSGSWTGTNSQKTRVYDGNLKLTTLIPTRSNYAFVGWCDQPTTTNTCPSGKAYGPEEGYPMSKISDITLYAVWDSSPNKGNLGSMQSFNCKSMLPNYDSYGTATDSRDNNTYSVARLHDGRCWMTQNLKISNLTLTPNNTDIVSNYSLSYNSGSSYSWLKATANSGAGLSETYDEAPYSICPKGWKLPSADEMGGLIIQYNESSAKQGPINFTSRLWTSSVGTGNDVYYMLLDNEYFIASSSRSISMPIRCISRQ